MAYINAVRRPAVFDHIRNLVERAREAQARHRLFVATLRELDALSDRDLNDIGVSRLQISDIARKHAYGL